MANLTLPDDVKIVISNLSLIHPGQVVHRSLYGAGSQVLARGPGYWSGRLRIGEMDNAEKDVRAGMESFLARLKGQENTFDVPIFRPTRGELAEGTTIEVSSSSINSSGELVVTFSGDSADGDLVLGDYVSIGNRLFQLIADTVYNSSGSTMKLSPPHDGDWTSGVDILWEEVVCRGRLVNSSVPNVHSPDFGGPWELEWEEAI